jgi:hypothetical protein
MTEGTALRGQALVVQKGRRRDPDAWLFDRHDHKHEPSWERQRKEALVKLDDTNEEDAKHQLEELRAGGPYWEISVYTREELEAIRESDKLDPDLAEYYKDFLED